MALVSGGGGDDDGVDALLLPFPCAHLAYVMGADHAWSASVSLRGPGVGKVSGWGAGAQDMAVLTVSEAVMPA